MSTTQDTDPDSLTTHPIDFIQLARESGLIFNEESGTEIARLRHEERIVIFASKVLQEVRK